MIEVPAVIENLSNYKKLTQFNIFIKYNYKFLGNINKKHQTRLYIKLLHYFC